MKHSLQGKRILVTHSDAFMGPALCEVFAEQGAQVVASREALLDADAAKQAVQQALSAGGLDAVVANLAHPAPSTPAAEVSEAEWQDTFAALVNPLPRLLAAALPALRSPPARGQGKFLVIGSAAALRGMKRCSTYSAARGAQLAWVQAVGVELAAQKVNVNAIAQNFVDNPSYFPPEVQANPRFQERLAREVPLGRLVAAREDALLAAYLCSDAADCFVGQVFPMSGGWVTR
jgi:2-keto-3-deoxy-L-fuconate dehydrogenase